MSWHKVIKTHEIPAVGGRRKVLVEGKELSILHTAEGLYCIDYRCPHTGGPLGDGKVFGSGIVCPLHRWKIDMSDGSHAHLGQTPAAGVYQLRLDGDEVMVEI